MKIGLVLPAIPAYSETFFRSKIKGLQANGYEVIIFLSHKPNKETDQIGSPVYFTDIGTSFWSRLIKSTIALMLAFGKAPKASIKLFYLHRLYGDSLGTCIRSIIINSHVLLHRVDWLHFGFATMGIGRELVGQAIGARVAVSFRGYDINQYPHHAGRNIYQRLWATTDKVHSISNALRNTAIQKLGFPHDLDTEIITPAINTVRFGSYKIENKLSGGNTIKCLVVSRLHWIKNIESVLEAIAILIRKGLDIRLTIVGSGKEEERLKFAVKQLDISDAVSWLGKLPHVGIPAIMADHDIFIQYSLEEGFCNTVLEAQASGMLVIVSDAKGLMENVVNDQTAWVAPKLNPIALSETILKVVQENPEERRVIQYAARERVISHFQVKQQQKAFLKFYAD